MNSSGCLVRANRSVCTCECLWLFGSGKPSCVRGRREFGLDKPKCVRGKTVIPPMNVCNVILWDDTCILLKCYSLEMLPDCMIVIVYYGCTLCLAYMGLSATSHSQELSKFSAVVVCHNVEVPSARKLTTNARSE